MYDQKSNEVNVNLLSVMNLVRESKKKKLSQKKLTRTLLEHRWSYDIVQNSPCLDENQEYDVIRKTAEELNLVQDIHAWAPEEDLAFGIELYLVIQNYVKCVV